MRKRLLNLVHHGLNFINIGFSEALQNDFELFALHAEPHRKAACAEGMSGIRSKGQQLTQDEYQSCSGKP
jgi:hypothetical protein